MFDLKGAWLGFVLSLGATHAVTLAYNNVWGGTILPGLHLVTQGESVPVPNLVLPTPAQPYRLPCHRKIRPEQVQADLDQVHRCIDRKLFGTRFNLLPPDRRTAFAGFIENADANIHAHLAWRVPPERAEEFELLVGPSWKKITHYGSHDVDPVYDAAGWIEYCAKRQFRSVREGPELFVYSR